VTTALHETRNMLRGAKSVILDPPAKINLSLVVFGLRPDGYHQLHTVMATVDMCDRLQISLAESEGIHLNCTGLPSPVGSDNLVYQAAELLAEHVGMSLALEISLHKRIPSGAGLGGASSDAAACLVGLNHLWQLNLPRGELSRLAARLGSDVPFFLHGPVACCTGRGEIVQSLAPIPSGSVLLILPEIHVPTVTVYRNYRHDEAQCQADMARVEQALKVGDLGGLAELGINSLSDTCLRLFEPLAQLHRKIEDMGIGPLHICGSGSGLFALSRCRSQIQRWSQQLQQRNLAASRIVTFQDHSSLLPEVHHAGF